MRWTFTELGRDVTFEQILPLASVKAELDVTAADDDALITAHRDAAIRWVENHTNRFLGTTRLRFLGDRIGSGGLTLPFAPVVSVQAMRVAGNAVVGFRSIGGEPWTILAPSGQNWPTYTQEAGAIEVDYTVGYAAGAANATLLQGVKMVAAIFYDRPANPQTDWEAVMNLLHPVRYSGFA